MTTVQYKNSELVDLLSPFTEGANSSKLGLISLMQLPLAFPALIGFWPGAAAGASGALVDMSGNGLHMSNVGACVFDAAIAPHMTLNGTNYFSVADTAVLDIAGNESYVASPGLTIGAWVRFNFIATSEETIIGKTATGQTSYYLARGSNGKARMTVSGDGSETFGISSEEVLYPHTWYFVVGCFSDGVNVVKVNEVPKQDSDGIPSSIYASTAPLRIGADGNAGNKLAGNVCGAFVCASAVGESLLSLFYGATAPLFA